MKVALIDNMNNNLFALARYLRDEGIDAHLFCIPGSSDHFQPAADTFQDLSNCDWIHEFPIDYVLSVKNFAFQPRHELRFLMEYDLIIACGFALAFLWRSEIRTDVFIPYGGDLYLPAFFKEHYKDQPHKHGIRLLLSWLHLLVWQNRLFQCQQTAIQHARTIVVNDRHSLYCAALKELQVGNLNLSVPMCYNREELPTNIGWQFLSNHDFILFHHPRHMWTSNVDRLPDFAIHGGNKRNDKVIRAFADFVGKATRVVNPLLVTFEYGPDVDHSKQLVAQQGIEKHVKWMPQTFRRDIMAGLKYASLGTDQFRYGLSGIGGTGYEVLASGVPLLTHTHGATADPYHPFYKAPIIDVLEETEILEVFLDWERSPEKYRELGEVSRIWFEENLGIGLAKKYVKLLEILVQDPTATHDSPEIRGILSRATP